MKYSFNNPESTIKELDIFKRGNVVEANIYLPSGATAEQLEQVSTQLQSHHYGVIAGIEAGGANVLRISGFGSAANLLATMADDKSVVGDYATTVNEHDTQTEFKDENAGKRAIKTLSGIGYSVGNLSTVTAGVMRGMKTGQWSEAAQGAAWTLPGFGLIIDGLQTADSQMTFLYEDLNDFLKTNDIKVPVNVQNLLDERKSGGIIDDVRRFATGNSSATFAAAESTGAVFGVIAGIEQKNAYKAIGTGIMGMGMLAGAIIPEEHHTSKYSNLLGNNTTMKGSSAPEITEKDGGVIGWIKEKPMRIAGILANVQNVIKWVGTSEVDEKRRMNFDGVLQNESLRGNEEQILASVRNGEDIWKTDKQGVFGKLTEKPIVSEYYTEKVKLQDAQAKATEKLTSIAKDADGYKDSLAELTKSGNDLAALDQKRLGYQASDDAVFFDKLAIGAFIVSNGLTMLTGKDNSPNLVKSGGVNSAIEICANVVLEQHADEQKAMTQRLATFLGNNAYVKLGIDEVVTLLNDKVEALAQSKWVSLEGNRQSLEDIYQKNKPDNKLETERQSLERLYEKAVQTPSMASV